MGRIVKPKPDAKVPVGEGIVSVGPNGQYYTKLQLDWVPMPWHLLDTLGWKEGDELELVPIHEGQVVIRKKGALAEPPPRSLSDV